MKSIAETNLKNHVSGGIPASVTRCMTGIKSWLMIQCQPSCLPFIEACSHHFEYAILNSKCDTKYVMIDWNISK